MTSPAPVYGGNKVRKLEYLLGDALQRGCDAVVTFGAAGSNHALATAIYARQVGLVCHAVLTDQVQTPWVANTLRWHALLGTRLWPAAGFAETQTAALALRASHPSGPDRLYEVAWGGSSPLGSLGFVDGGHGTGHATRRRGTCADRSGFTCPAARWAASRACSPAWARPRYPPRWSA